MTTAADGAIGHRRRSRARLIAYAAAVVVAILALYVLLPRVGGLDETWGRLQDGDPGWIALAAVFELGSYAGYVLLLRTVGGGPELRLSWPATWRLTPAGIAASRLLATAGAGGIALTAWALGRMGLGAREITARMATFFVLLYGVFMAALVVAGLGLSAGWLGGPAPFGMTVVAALFSAAVISAALALALLPPHHATGPRDGDRGLHRRAVADALEHGVGGRRPRRLPRHDRPYRDQGHGAPMSGRFDGAPFCGCAQTKPHSPSGTRWSSTAARPPDTPRTEIHPWDARGTTWCDYGSAPLARATCRRTFESMFADQFLPTYDVSDSVAVVVDANAARTWDALMDVDLMDVGRRKPLVGILTVARALPAIARDLLRGKLPAPPPKQMRLRDTVSMPASDGGWVLLGDEPGASIALGLVGTFWRPVIAFAQVDRGRFRDFAEPGLAKTVYELSVRELPDGRTLLTGLMRTATTDERARRMFRRYWTFGVGSGAHVLVNGVLDSAREIAERGNAGPEPVPTRVAEPDRAGVT